MAIARKNIKSEDDFLKVGPDVTATFDNSPSNPTEYASSENLRAPKIEDDDLEEEDEDEDVDEEEEDFDEEEDEEDEIDEDDDEEDEDEDDDLATGPRAPSVYRRS